MKKTALEKAGAFAFKFKLDNTESVAGAFIMDDGTTVHWRKFKGEHCLTPLKLFTDEQLLNELIARGLVTITKD